MANRKTVNSDFSYYFSGDRLALLYQNQSSGKLESWSEADVGDGLRIHYTAKYEAAKYFDNNFRDDLGVDSGLQIAILEFIKHRLEEDLGNMQKSAYFLQKYRQKISTYPHSRKGIRGIKLPPL